MRAVLERDLVYEASRPRAFRSRTYLGVLVATAVIFVLYFNRAILQAAPDRLAAYVFRAGAGVVAVMLAILTPAAVSGAVLGERVQETLALVLSTPVGPRRFALAKLLSRTAVVLSWGLAALLPLGMTILLGGVGGAEVLRFVGLCAAVVIEFGAWGLWVSTATRRPATAAMLSYLMPAGRIAGFCVLGGFLSSLGGTVGRLFVALTPVPAFLEVVDPGSGMSLLTGMGRAPQVAFMAGRGRFFTPPAPAPTGLLAEPVLLALLAAILLAVVSVLVSGWRLRSEAEPARPWELRMPSFGKRKRKVRHPPDGGNPVAWKEGSLFNTGASRPLYYLALAAVIAVEAVYVLQVVRSGSWQGDMWSRFWNAWGNLSIFSWVTAGLCLVACVNGASSIAHERTQGTWDLLRASPLTTRQLAEGKILGLLLGMGILALLPVAHLGIGLATGALSSGWVVLAGAILLATLLLFWTVLGMVCGARARVPGRALFLAASAYAIGFIGIPILAALFGGYWTRKYLGMGPGLGTAVRSGGPWHLPFQSLLWVEDIRSEFPVRNQDFWAYDFFGQLFAEGLWALAWAVALAGATWWLLRVLVRRLSAEDLEERLPEGAGR